MSNGHPSSEDLNLFLSRPASTARNGRVVRHLLAECPACQEHLRQIGWPEDRLERLLRISSSESADVENAGYFSMANPSYDQAFGRAQRAVDAFFAPVRPLEQAPELLLAELELLSSAEQIRQAGSDPRYALPQLVHFLSDRSHAIRYHAPEKMLHLADLARTAAEACLSDDVGGELRLADLRSWAWGHYGNALRICGRLREAEEALTRAAALREEGTGDPPLRARLLELAASLNTFQRRFEAAISLAEAAADIYRDLGETHMLASALVQKAIAALYSGETESAVDILNHAIPLIDHEGDPHLLLAACHNLVHCYLGLDRPEQALSIYSETRELYKEFSDSLIQLRVGWQEGQLLRELGHLRAAETSLLQARSGFMERGLMYEVAVVSLDLAALYVTMHSIEEVRQIVIAAVPIFRALGVDREALASLLQLQQVADQEQEALELIRFLNARIEPFSQRRPLR
ncbi:MAG TPA: tetratricopeptide repeat protein [Thermoanaerobaculia bacterium]|jgi:tetratricopeptide (TPR) repeat protein|nr:tetratricopeptide repeat protein [Thermoanaerobaculia bacterium]